MDKDLFDAITGRLSMDEAVKSVVVLGSSALAPSINPHLADDHIVVAINNAHKAASRIDFSVYSGDFPAVDKASGLAVTGRSSPHYLPAMQRFGGLLFGGATMALAAGYWAINDFPFSQISYYACDMVYEGTQTHFYGEGQADPLRRNLSLQSLEAKTLRLFYFALANNVLLLNASPVDKTRLCFPHNRAGLSLRHRVFTDLMTDMVALHHALEPWAEAALKLEAGAPFDARRLDYWVYGKDETVWAYVAAVDEAWLAIRRLVDDFAILVNQCLEAKEANGSRPVEVM